MKADIVSQFQFALHDGYDKGKDKQYLKKKYIELLIQNCVVFQMIIDAVVKYIDNEQDLFSIMCKSAADAKNNGFTDEGIMRIIKDSLSTDPSFLEFAEKEISDIFLRKCYLKHQAEYFELMLKAWLERGQKLIKNDIFDMLCVGALDLFDPKLSPLVDQSSYLISFDETMMKFLYTNQGNAKLLNKFVCQ